MRNVFTIIDGLSAGLAQLKTALQPLAAFSSGGAVRTPQRARRTGRSGNGRRKASMKATKAAGSPKPTKAASRKTRKPVSPKLRAMRVQQGKYLAALRGLTVPQRAQVKKAKADGDYGSALKLATSLAKQTA
jgi:hypothetical protein